MDSKYVYIINYPDYEQELCELEQLYLFGSQQQAGKKYRFSDKRMSAGLSPFLGNDLIFYVKHRHVKNSCNKYRKHSYILMNLKFII